MTINRKVFHLCLDHAIEVIELFQGGGQQLGDGIHVMNIDAVIGAIKLHDDKLNITTDQRTEIVEALIAVFQVENFPPCATWHLAHALEHVLYRG